MVQFDEVLAEFGLTEHQLSVFSPWRWRLSENQEGIPLRRAAVSCGPGHAAATKALVLAPEATRQEEMCENVHFCPDRSEILAKSGGWSSSRETHENLLWTEQSSWILGVSLVKDCACTMESLLLHLCRQSYWRWAFCLCGYKKLTWQKSS